MNRVLVVSFVGWICAVAFALAGIGLFITKALVGQFEGSWWWVIGCGMGFIASLVVMSLPVLLEWRRM